MITKATLEDALVLADIFTRAETIYKTKKTIPWTEAILEAVNAQAQAPESAVTEVKDAEVFGYVSLHTNGMYYFNKDYNGVYRDTAVEITPVKKF